MNYRVNPFVHSDFRSIDSFIAKREMLGMDSEEENVKLYCIYQWYKGV
jgi:hypothetical protein